MFKVQPSLDRNASLHQCNHVTMTIKLQSCDPLIHHQCSRDSNTVDVEADEPHRSNTPIIDQCSTGSTTVDVEADEPHRSNTPIIVQEAGVQRS